MKRLLPWVGLAYPLLVHLGVSRNDPDLIAAALMLLAILLLAPGLYRRSGLAWGILLVLCVLLVGGSQRLPDATAIVYAVPVLMNLFFAWLFGHTLVGPRPALIELLVRALHPPDESVDDEVIRYARRLTAAWAALFVLLAALSAVAVMLPAEQWSLITHVGNLVLVGLLFVLEWFWRKRRFPDQPYTGFLDFMIRMGRAFPGLIREIIRP